ncbi:xanthine dehydrogenase accessory protein XdhC [Rhodobacteraceae bacterium D3-12]|nr:xanthine dehydrogenase accessory protein XdhC [Rhodobacteraceae bacterium D3-12]
MSTVGRAGDAGTGIDGCRADAGPVVTVAGFLAQHNKVVRVRIARVEGSSPREVGAEMLVSDGAMQGTIGGGQLEYMALDQARQMLQRGEGLARMNVPLGPEIGQCCGGRVELTLALVDAGLRAELVAAERAAQGGMAEVLIFGAGHVGRALATALAPLPVSTRLIDSREAELSQVDCAGKVLTPLPESEVAKAGRGAAFVVATHDHALDFLITAEALKRGDAAYVGMIGSKSKRAKFTNWADANEPLAEVSRLVCPMGLVGVGDKRPEVIAAHVVSEVLLAIEVFANIRQGMEAAL